MLVKKRGLYNSQYWGSGTWCWNRLCFGESLSWLCHIPAAGIMVGGGWCEPISTLKDRNQRLGSQIPPEGAAPIGVRASSSSCHSESRHLPTRKLCHSQEPDSKRGPRGHTQDRSKGQQVRWPSSSPGRSMTQVRPWGLRSCPSPPPQPLPPSLPTASASCCRAWASASAGLLLPLWSGMLPPEGPTAGANFPSPDWTALAPLSGVQPHGQACPWYPHASAHHPTYFSLRLCRLRFLLASAQRRPASCVGIRDSWNLFRHLWGAVPLNAICPPQWLWEACRTATSAIA